MIWRWVGVVLGLAVILTGGSVLIARGTASDAPNCLIFTDPVYNAGQLDLRTGVALNVTSIPTRLQQFSTQTGKNFHQVMPSWDQKRFAYSLYDDKANQLQLFVKNVDHAGFGADVLVHAPVGKVGVSPQAYLPDFAWSPDSQRLAYWWQTADQRAFLSIADEMGHTQQAEPIPMKFPDRASVALTGFSADGSYFGLAVTVIDQKANMDSLLFWTVPDLRLVQTLQFTSPRSSSGAPILSGSWSPKGHQFAYWLTDDTTKELELGLISPSEKPYYFHFANASNLSLNAPNNLIEPGWSPDGRYLFAEYELTSGQNALVSQFQLNVIDTATKVVQPLTDQTMNPVLFGAFWSDDGRFLYYLQTNSKSPLVRKDLMLFRVAIDRSELLAPNLDLNFFDFVSRSILLYKQPGSDNDTIIALWKDAARIETFGGFKNGDMPVINPMVWFSDNELAVFMDTQRTSLHLINVRTGAQIHYDEPALSDAISNLSFTSGWLSGVRLGPPPMLKLVRLSDGTEHDIPLPYDTIGQFPDTTVWSSDGAYIAIISRNQAYPDSPFTVDVVRVADGRVQHIRNVSPVFNSTDTTLASIAFGKCG